MKRLLIITTLILAPSGFAAPIPELVNFFEQEVVSLDEAMPVCKSGEAQAWYLRNFWLRIRGKYGFQIPEFATLQIIPEVEMLWQRDWPEAQISD